MSHEIQLMPELAELIDEFVSVGERFSSLAESYTQLEIQLRKKEKELENNAKQLSAMRHTEMENERLRQSYEQLKTDYDLQHSAMEIHQKEVRAENNKRVRELEAELSAAKAKASEQANSHQIVVNQIVNDYEAKLRNADAKIRQLNSARTEPSHLKHADTASKNKRFGQLAVEVGSRGSGNRGRGRARGAAHKRKLFVSEYDGPTDLAE